MKKIYFVLVLGLVGGGLYLGSSKRVIDFVERDAPKIRFKADDGKIEKVAIGRKPRALDVLLDDSGAGVERVKVTLTQDKKNLLLLERSFPRQSSIPSQQRTSLRKVSFDLPGREAKLKEGAATLSVEVFDHSLWSNRAVRTASLPVDFKKPEVEVLTRQYAVTQGGAELVLFRIMEDSLEYAAILVGEFEFPAVPAQGLSKQFSDIDNCYASLFALPLGFDVERDGEVMLVVRDIAHNVVRQPITFRIKKKAQREVTPELTTSFVREKAIPLLEDYYHMKGSEKSPIPAEGIEEDGSIPRSFITVNEKFRSLLEQELKKFSAQSAITLDWDGVFIKPMASAVSSSFGEIRHYTVDGMEAGGSRHDGLDLASVKQDVVKASNKGTVLHAGSFGIYGKTIIVDHGLGLQSLYGHLSSVSVSAGDSVEKGQQIGRTGESGLAGGDHLHFEFRLGSVPVDPREWWDDHWMKDNIDFKFETALALLKPREDSELPK